MSLKSACKYTCLRAASSGDFVGMPYPFDYRMVPPSGTSARLIGRIIPKREFDLDAATVRTAWEESHVVLVVRAVS